MVPGKGDQFVRKAEIYLREGFFNIGPFCSREDAESFLILMELLGESSEGIEIVEVNVGAQLGRQKGSVVNQCSGSSGAGLPRKRSLESMSIAGPQLPKRTSYTRRRIQRLG
jgi:hypothetical protein